MAMLMCVADVDDARFYVQFGEEFAIDYLIDAATLTEVVEDPNWREEANRRIELIRMDDLTIK